jgi:hypothetical protein
MLWYQQQIADQFIPIYIAISVVLVLLMLWAAYALIIKPFLRG